MKLTLLKYPCRFPSSWIRSGRYKPTTISKRFRNKFLDQRLKSYFGILSTGLEKHQRRTIKKQFELYFVKISPLVLMQIIKCINVTFFRYQIHFIVKEIGFVNGPRIAVYWFCCFLITFLKDPDLNIFPMHPCQKQTLQQFVKKYISHKFQWHPKIYYYSRAIFSLKGVQILGKKFSKSWLKGYQSSTSILLKLDVADVERY